MSMAGIDTELLQAGLHLLPVKRPKEQYADIFRQIHLVMLIKWTMLWSPISDQEEQIVIHASYSSFQVVKFNSSYE